ncbi:hypothetical protein N9M50_03050 [Alphaproteobacteria bacterium]|nr:hypothetical protein [Alphaproteobacteria bacterium]
MLKVLGTVISIDPVDDAGETKIEIKMGMRNVSNVYFDKVLLKAELIDKKGNAIDESRDYQSVSTFSGKILSPSFWSLKPSRLKKLFH